jgi:small subunit ribosomal protein S20
LPAKNSAAKRQRQNEKRRNRNRTARSRIHTVKRRFLEAIDQSDRETAESAFSEVSNLIDSAANKGIYHRNTADRKKSRLHKKLNALGAE